jgi:hypothetical protein
VTVLVTTAGAPLISLEWMVEFLVGSLAMADDLLSSFPKRRTALPPSSRARGLDQVPEALFPLLACRHPLYLTITDLSITAALSFYRRGIAFSRVLSVSPARSAILASAHRRWCKVISGRQLIRTGTRDDPTPTEV